MSMTVATLKNNGANTIFFRNARFHGDTEYVFNEARMELTVKGYVEDLGHRRTTWTVDQTGKITDLIKH